MQTNKDSYIGYILWYCIKEVNGPIILFEDTHFRPKILSSKR